MEAPAQTMIYTAPVPATPDEPAVEPEREVVTLTVAGRKHEVTKRSTVLGRSREADIRLADVNVSRRHAELRQEGATYWIVDLGSTNGLEVNGKRAERARLRDGDRITMARPRSCSGARSDVSLLAIEADETLLILKSRSSCCSTVSSSSSSAPRREGWSRRRRRRASYSERPRAARSAPSTASRRRGSSW